jgi:hypothetical protein
LWLLHPLYSAIYSFILSLFSLPSLIYFLYTRRVKYIRPPHTVV